MKLPSDLNPLLVFATVAETLSFRMASERLGITRSAVSQSVRRLETSLGAALFLRTTRSVSLTEAGHRLFDRLTPALAELSAAISETADREAEPRGRLRLAVSSIAESFIDGPLLASYMLSHPAVELDVTITDEVFDIVARGYDAGVRLGEVVEKDMVAVPLTGDQKQVVVGAPSYIGQFGRPVHPRELAHHRCIGWRRLPELEPYHWDFVENGREFFVQVPATLTTNDMWLILRTALAGGGLTFGMRDSFEPYLASGALVPMLEAFCQPFAGFFLYFPERRLMAPKLRALIDHARAFYAKRGHRG